MNIMDCLNVAVAKLKTADIVSPRLDAELLLRHALNTNREWIIAHGDNIINDDESRNFDELINCRISGEPVAYLTGHKEFYGRNFIVNSDVLIPRPETEALVEFIKNLRMSNPKILDVGTGSCAIAITLSLEIPSAKVTASDISEKALVVARNNATALDSNINFVKSDLMNNIVGTFDLIVANLPYVGRDWIVSPETKTEPEIALFADDDGLDLMKKLITKSADYLENDSFLVLEMDTRQLNSISEFAKQHKFEVIAKDKFLLALKKTG